MIKKILTVVLVLILAFVLFTTVQFFRLGRQSAEGSAPGLVNGKLTRCPATPNCVNSEYVDDTDHLTAPVTLVQKDPAKVRQTVLAVIEDMHGRVTASDGNYIHATFTSKLFGFVDDFEVRIDPQSGLMHLRSASRVGHGDLGVNARRVDKFTNRFARRVGAGDS